MALNGSIVITTKVDTTQAESDLKGLVVGIKTVEKEQVAAAKAAADHAEKMQRVAEVSRSAAIGLGIFGAALGAAAIGSIKLAADLEQSRVAFTTLLGSGEKAKKFLDELAAFAAQTPFEFVGLQDSARRLLAFGFAAQDIIPLMNSIGNAVAGLGGGKEQIDRVTLALGQMQAKGKVSAEEMNQLAELGIPGWKMIASAIGVSIPEAMKLAEKGAIDSTTAINALITGMNDKFPGMMEKQSKTINGVFSNLVDGATLTATLIGERLISAFHITEAVGAAARAVSGFANIIKTGGLKEAVDSAFPPGLRAVLIGIAGALTASLAPALGVAATAFGAAVVAAAPFLAIGAGIAAAAYLIMKNWDPLSSFFSDLFGKIGKMAEDLRDTIVGALGGPVAQLGGSGRSSMRLSQAGATIKPAKIEKAVAQPIDYFAGFKNLFDEFVPNLKKIMDTTVKTVVDTKFTGLSGKTSPAPGPGNIEKEQKERINAAKQILENALNKADLGKAFDYDAAERALLSYADVLRKNGATASEIEEVNIRILDLHKKQGIESQKSADIFEAEAEKARKKAEQAAKETQQRTATGLRETYGIATQFIKNDFQGLANSIQSHIENAIVNALSANPAVQSAMNNLSTFLTGPAGIAISFGALLTLGILNAGTEMRKLAQEAAKDALSVDMLLNPDKYKGVTARAGEIQNKIKELTDKYNDMVNEFNLKAAGEARDPTGISAMLNEQFAGGSSATVKKRMEDTFGLIQQLGTELENELGKGANTLIGTLIGKSLPSISKTFQDLLTEAGISPATFQGAVDKATGKTNKPAVMPGETPDRPIYTQVVNVRDFREAFPDSAYFRAPSVDTTRSLNANAVAYR
jgi:tape measure domain-containing protein